MQKKAEQSTWEGAEMSEQAPQSFDKELKARKERKEKEKKHPHRYPHSARPDSIYLDKVDDTIRGFS